MLVAFAYDHVAQAHKAERERAAADRIFGLLPPDQAAPVRALWDEFEAQETIESRLRTTRSIGYSLCCRMFPPAADVPTIGRESER